MFKKIVFSLLVFDLVVAIGLYLYGIRVLSFDSRFYNLFLAISRRIGTFEVLIPNIPSIDIPDAWYSIFVVLVNGLGAVLNILIYLLNLLIMVFKFVTTIFISIIEFVKTYDVVIS